MGSRVTRVMGFLPAKFQLAMPFHSQLRVRHGTDRQTDRQWSSMLNATTLWRRGIIMYRPVWTDDWLADIHCGSERPVNNDRPTIRRLRLELMSQCCRLDKPTATIIPVNTHTHTHTRTHRHTHTHTHMRIHISMYTLSDFIFWTESRFKLQF